MLLANGLDSPLRLQLSPGNSAFNIFSRFHNHVNFALKNALSFWPLVDGERVDEAIQTMYNTTALAQSYASHDMLAVVYAIVALDVRHDSAMPRNILNSPNDAECLIG